MEDMEIFMDIFQSRDVHSLLSSLSLNLALFYYWIFSSGHEIVDLEKKNAKSKDIKI